MYKEAVICAITVIGIIVLNIITGNFTKDSVEELTRNLTELRDEISENEDSIENQNTRDKVDTIFEQWYRRYNVLAFYLEHDELEKVEANLTSLRSAIDADDYSEALSELDECSFVLKHIQQKNSFAWKNIF